MVDFNSLTLIATVFASSNKSYEPKSILLLFTRIDTLNLLLDSLTPDCFILDLVAKIKLSFNSAAERGLLSNIHLSSNDLYLDHSIKSINKESLS